MSTETRRDLARIQAEAAEWIACLHSREVTNEQRQQFNSWIRQSSEHRIEFINMREMMADVQNAVEGYPFPQPLKIRRGGSGGLLITVCLIVSLVTVVFRYYLYNDWLADHRTAIGQQRTVTLADGSTLYLNTDSAVAVDFNEFQRRIKLLRGEAEFVVVHDSERPFSVATDKDMVTALGTDFSVRRLDDELTVTVFENAVQVKGMAGPHAIVEQGQQMRRLAQHSQPQIGAVGIEEARAWRDGNLMFTDRPLREVIAEINRYRHGKIVLLAEDSGERPVSGNFLIERLDDSAAVIASTLSLDILQLGGLDTVLY